MHINLHLNFTLMCIHTDRKTRRVKKKHMKQACKLYSQTRQIHLTCSHSPYCTSLCPTTPALHDPTKEMATKTA